MIQTLKHRGYQGSVDVSLEDKCLFGKILFIDDSVSYEGETLLELEEQFQEAVHVYLETCEELGRNPDKPYSGTFNVRVGPERHVAAVKAAYTAGMNLNEFVGQAISEKLEQNSTVRHVHDHRVTVFHGTYSVDNLPEQEAWETQYESLTPTYQ